MNSFKKTNKAKKIRVCKKGSASEAIGTIEKGSDTFILTFGQFSLVDALLAILDQTGPAHVCISTWTAAHAHLDKSMEMVESVTILSLRMIVDRSFKTRQPKYFEHMINLFGVESIRETRTHAKFLTIRNDNFDIVVRTSMNLNENPRMENIEVSESYNFADFFEKVVDDIFLEIPIGEQCKSTPTLANIADDSPFKLISAKHIKRSSTNEIRFSHTV